jgi:hypothetical protein
MNDDTDLLFDLPSVSRKKVSAAFDGGLITSDGGVALLALADRRIGIVDRIAGLIADPRDRALVTHSVASILRARVLAIACGYEDGNDLDRLRGDPAFKLACGRLPVSGGDLCSQPTVSRWENAPDLKTVIRLTYAMVDAWCDSYDREPEAVTLDIDDTVDVVHGHQQLSLFHAHHDERCFLPIHIYDTATGRPVAVILRPGKTPSGKEAAGYLRRLHRRIRRHWPKTRLTIRGDGHYGRPELMDFCDRHGLDYLFGVTGTKALAARIEDVVDPIRVQFAQGDGRPVRGFAHTRHGAKSWKKERRVVARIEATHLGLDIRYVVTSLEAPTAEDIYATGREPHQAAQVPTEERPHLLPLAPRQPDAPDSAHRRLLADAHRPRRHPQGPRPRQGRVRHPAPQAPQDRRPHPRNPPPRPRRLRRRLSRSRALPPPRHSSQRSARLTRRAKPVKRTAPHPNPFGVPNLRPPRDENGAVKNRARSPEPAK